MDPDPDPGGPKTCGSGGSGSATLEKRRDGRGVEEPLDDPTRQIGAKFPVLVTDKHISVSQHHFLGQTQSFVGTVHVTYRR